MTVQRTGRAIASDLIPTRKSQRALCTGRRLPTLPISVAGPAVNGVKENPASQTNNSAWVTKPSSTSGPTSGSFHTEKSFARFVRNIIFWGRNTTLIGRSRTLRANFVQDALHVLHQVYAVSAHQIPAE
jgi:hypothetical protein